MGTMLATSALWWNSSALSAYRTQAPGCVASWEQQPLSQCQKESPASRLLVWAKLLPSFWTFPSPTLRRSHNRLLTTTELVACGDIPVKDGLLGLVTPPPHPHQWPV